jgi:hypothetical protein
MLPDEDLFYYATGREPHFPVLEFDTTTSAYSFEEALKLKRRPELRWLIVKREKQLDDADINSALRRLAKRFEPEFTRVKRLRNYDVYGVFKEQVPAFEIASLGFLGTFVAVDTCMLSLMPTRQLYSHSHYRIFP